MDREVIARALCEMDGRSPEGLEPGDDPYMNNSPVIDAYVHGEPCHYRWRGYVPKADAVLAALEASGRVIVSVEAALNGRVLNAWIGVKEPTDGR